MSAEGRLPDVIGRLCGRAAPTPSGCLPILLMKNPWPLVGVEAGGEGLESGKHAVRVVGDAQDRDCAGVPFPLPAG